MASTTGYDLPIRQALRERGISDADIGYDKATGYVTIRGQPFMQPARVYMGTSYANQQDFETAWQNYLRSQQTTNQPQINVPKATTQPQTVSTQPATSRTTPDYSSIYNIGNPYDQRVAEAISSLQSLIQQIQQPVSLESIYASPQYAAFQAQAQRQAQQGIRAAQEALGAAGFGRSTLLGERAQEIQNLANEYLQTQVLPQLIAAEEARRQAQLENALAFIRQLAQQQAVMEGRYESAAERALREAQLTGQYLPAEARALIDSLLELKRQAESPGITREARAELSRQADVIRSQLVGMGVDPSLFGADVPAAQAQQNIGRAGVQTLEAQQFAYQQARDKIADERYKQEFDEDVRRFNLEYALDKAVKNRQLSQEDARIALQKANLSLREQELELERSLREQELELERQREARLSQPEPKTAESMRTYFDSMVVPDPVTNEIQNKDQLERAILESGLPEYEIYKLYLRYGLPWNGPIPTP